MFYKLLSDHPLIHHTSWGTRLKAIPGLYGKVLMGYLTYAKT